MRLIPKKRQWEKWSLPSKVAIIAAYLTIISSPIWFISLIKLLPLPEKEFNYKKYYKEFAEGLLNFAYRHYDKAQEDFNNLIKQAPNEDLKDVYVWLAETYARNKQYEKAYQIYKEYYEDIDTNVTFEELQYLALTRLITLLKNGEFEKLLEYTKELLKYSELSNLEEIEALAYLTNQMDDELMKVLNEKKYEFETAEYFRITQYSIWNDFVYYFNTDSTRLIYFLGLMFQNNTHPEKFEIDHFCIYEPLGNLTIQSLNKRMIYQNKLDSTLKELSNSNSIFSNYKNELIKFGLNIGSIYSLKLFLNQHNATCYSLFSKISKIKKEEEINLIFIPLIKNAKLYILWASGEPHIYTAPDNEKDSFSDYIKEIKPLRKINLRLIEIDNKNINISEIDFQYGDDLGRFWFYIHPIEYDNYDYLFIETTGTGHYKGVYTLSINTLEINNIFPSGAERDCSYHSHNAYFTDWNDKTLLKWRFELDNYCEANVFRKVYGVTEFILKPDGTLRQTKYYFPNPALEFFENLNKSKLKLQNFLTEKLVIQGKKIKDKKFRDYITQRNIPCYMRTKVDESYSYMPEISYPNISCLHIHYPSDDEIGFFEEHELDDNVKEKADYLLLVKRFRNEIKILDIFEIKDTKVIKSVIFN